MTPQEGEKATPLIFPGDSSGGGEGGGVVPKMKKEIFEGEGEKMGS